VKVDGSKCYLSYDPLRAIPAYSSRIAQLFKDIVPTPTSAAAGNATVHITGVLAIQ